MVSAKKKYDRKRTYEQSLPKFERVVVTTGTTAAKRAGRENQYRCGDGVREARSRERPPAARRRVTQRQGDNQFYDFSIPSPA